MKRWITIMAISSMSAACSPIVLEPIDDGPAPAASSPPVARGLNAIAMRGEDVLPGLLQSIAEDNALPDALASLEPEALVLLFSNVHEQCAAAKVPMECGPDPSWQYVVEIPLALDKPGVIDLTDPSVHWISSETGPEPAPCNHGTGVGDGAAANGTLEIARSDATSLSLTLHGTDPLGFQADGDYTAYRCGLPPAAPAIVIRGVDLPPPPMGGAKPDPNTLFVFIGTATCADPWSAIDCTNSSRMTFEIPPSLQQPGELDLTDPRLAATFAFSLNDAKPNCSGGGGTFTAGTLEIDSIDAKGLSFTLTGTLHTESPEGLVQGFDGSYVSSVCP